MEIEAAKICRHRHPSIIIVLITTGGDFVDKLNHIFADFQVITMIGFDKEI